MDMNRTVMLANRVVMLVSDDIALQDSLDPALRAAGFEVKKAERLFSCFPEILASAPKVILADYALSDGTASDLLAWLKGAERKVPVIVFTERERRDLGAKAINDGATRVIAKPIEIDHLTYEVQLAIENFRVPDREAVAQSSRARYEPSPFLGSSSAIMRLESAATRVSQANCSVLIQGETGTGKGVLAHWLHRRGPRASQPFVDLNCAGLSGDLLESEIFGHKKGAFTGALANKLGLLEAANRGTLFLDEIGDMSLGVQAKILKVVEEKRFYRLGEVNERRVDVQIIAATHRDLKKDASSGSFRSDLYFRISTLCLYIPALRERLEDIPILTDALIHRFGWDLKQGPVHISDKARLQLQNYPWPGNIRELRNVLERAAILSEDGVIRQLGIEFEATDYDRIASIALANRFTLSEMERHYILLAIEAEGGHVARAAKRLGMARSSLYEKIREYGLSANSKAEISAESSSEDLIPVVRKRVI